MRSGNHIPKKQYYFNQSQNQSRLNRLVLVNTGFTLVELLVVMAILAMLLSLAMPRYFVSVDRAKEQALKQELHTVRKAIDQYIADQGQYPETLQDLVNKKYLNKPPFDPIAQSSDTWVIAAPDGAERGAVADIHSGSTALASDGSPYANW